MDRRQVKTAHVCTVTSEQADKLRDLVEQRGWKLSAAPYARWQAAGPEVMVIAYCSGKLVIQGKGTADFVQFQLEPEVLGQARFGYERELRELEHPAMFQPHAGIDESGKGDFFGPLVVAAVYTDDASGRAFLDLGVADSKTIKSDKRIHELARDIRTRVGDGCSVVAIGPETYNRLHLKFGNVNRLLAWGHARALENLLDHCPTCPRAISDQFGHKSLVERALLEKGRKLVLEQRHRAEADVAVAAASIIARSEFVRRLERLGVECGVELPKGAGAGVDAAGRVFVAKYGAAALGRVAKTHFRTTEKVLGLPPRLEAHQDQAN